MSALDDILGQLPIDQIAQEVGAQPQEVQQAASAVLPALLGGLQANASGGGADSLLQALGQHDNDLLSDGVDLSSIDTDDGAAIASHIFGDHEDAVVNQLGGLGGSSGGSGLGSALIKKLIPILAPIVLSYIANQVFGKMGQVGGATAPSTPTSPSLPTQQTQPTSSDSGSGSGGRGNGPGSLQDMLQDVLGQAMGGASAAPAPQQQQQQQQGVPGADSILTDILGGLLGGGRR